ncbi:MAG: PD-(D/E)XK nuclease family protein [Gammaproteobacteria bacterium]
MISTPWQTLDQKFTLVLTPNNRLTLHLGSLSTGNPSILPFSIWLTNLSKELPGITYLPPEPELFIWQDIIEKSSFNDALINISFLAEKSQEAWDFLVKNQITIEEVKALANNENQYAFIAWAEEFTRRKLEKNFVETASLATVITEALEKKEVNIIQKNIFLVGFDYLPPLWRSLCEILQKHDYQITEIDPQSNADIASPRVLSFSDSKEEILTMARWAKATIEKNPEINIGCIVPKLSFYQDEIKAILGEVFPDPSSYNISLGKPLGTYPLITAILKILSLGNKEYLELEEILLQTRLLETRLIASLLEDILRKSKKRKFTWKELFSLSSQNPSTSKNPDGLPQENPEKHVYANSLFFNELQNQMQFLLSNRHKKLPPSAWIQIFRDLIASSPLNSEEFQVVKRWNQLLDSFAEYDSIMPLLSYGEAVSSIKYLAMKTQFQPEQPKDAKLQILGALEAAGINFDKIWLLGMDEESWPAGAHPNQFLALHLQKKQIFGHASLEQEWQFAEKLTGRFLRSSSEIIVSYTNVDEERELQVSHFFRDSTKITSEELTLSPFQSRREAIYAKRNTIEALSTNAPPVAPDEKISGGERILSNQAACPFRAFAEHRLHAKELEEPEFGISKLTRGQLIHKILESIWRELNTQKKLIQLSDPELKNLVGTRTERALEAYSHKEEYSENMAFLENEFICLTRLITFWLGHEKLRPDFNIHSLETKTTLKLDELTLNLRIDRIDRLSDGSLVIIDYKTGKNIPGSEAYWRDWQDERPTSAQLPLYSLAINEAATGLLIGKINLNNMGFVGVTQHASEIKAVYDLEKLYKKDGFEHLTWLQVKKKWQETLTNLAKDFLSGKAEVNPKDGAKTCQMCHLAMLCRVE